MKFLGIFVAITFVLIGLILMNVDDWFMLKMIHFRNTIKKQFKKFKK